MKFKGFGGTTIKTNGKGGGFTIRPKKKTLAAKVKTLAKTVNFNKSETKIMSWNSGYSTVASTGSLQNLTGVVQALGNSGDRVGNVIQPKRLYLTCTSELSSSTSTVNQPVRWIVFRDNQQISDTAPTMSDLLYTPSDAVYSYYTLAYQKRFTILYDKTTMLNQQQHSQTIVKISIDLSKKKMIFNGPNAGDIQKYGIYLLIVSDQVITLPYFKYMGRMTYIDP